MSVICVDFDGVLNTYTGYRGDDELFEPKPGAEDFLRVLNQKGTVVIHTARDSQKVKKWLKQYHLDRYIHSVTKEKVPAIVYIDDRAIQFKGCFVETLQELESFKVHWTGKCPFETWEKEEEEYGSPEDRGLI